MTQSDLPPDDSHQEVPLAPSEDLFKQGLKALGTLLERITPWLVEFGSWLFGGLIAFNLLVIAALLPIGPGDPAILVAAVAFALALPLEVAGLFLLRVDKDLKQFGFEEEVAHAFQEVPFTGSEQVTASTTIEARRKRRTRVVLSYGLGILALSVALTVTGMMAALWHLAWWIAVAFLAMVLASGGIVMAALAASQPPGPAKKERQTNSSSRVKEKRGP